MFTTKKIAIVSVINDLTTDNRVNKTCMLLTECGYEVLLIGRRLPESLALPAWPFKSKRINMFFKKGPLFYFFFNLRLFWVLLFTKADLLYSNDLDTLLPNYLAARSKKIALIYDSHELFCEVPELTLSPFKKRIWQTIEQRIVPKLKTCITVNESIATIFEEKYGVKFSVVRNIPELPAAFHLKNRMELALPVNKKIILLQGAGINMDRGAEELVEAMKLVSEAVLYIIGSGDSWPTLEKMVKSGGLEEKVKLIKKIPKAELWQYTFNADIGISIDKNTNLNYYYSLPNKIFDYIQAGLPILASRLPEIERIIERYKIGDFISDHQPAHIAEKINQMLNSTELKVFKKNTEFAKQHLNWNAEKVVLRKVIEAASRSEWRKTVNNYVILV